MSEEFEQLSRYRAGELTPEAARALEAQPGFAERLRQLQALDAAVVVLPVGMPDAKLEALLGKVRRPEVKKRAAGPELRVGLVAAAVLVAVLGWTIFGNAGEQWVVVPSGDVKVDGKSVTAPTAQAKGKWELSVGPEATAQVVGSSAALMVPGGAQLTHGKTFFVERGTVLVRADDLTLGVVTVNGVSVLSMEPAEGVARVTQLLNTTTSGALMKSEWMKLSTVALTAAAVGSGLTLFVVDGHASVRSGDSAPVVINAGERWKAGDAKPTAYRAGAAVPSEAKAAALEGVSTRTAPELVAQIEALKTQNEALLQQREALKAKIEGQKDDAKPRRNYYRLEPDELLASARKGELRLRGPQLSGQELKVEPEVKNDLALTPDELAKIKEIFDASGARVRTGLLGLYKEIGGDMNAGSTLNTETLFNELRTKALKDEFSDSVRTMADERAGLIPPGNPSAGPASLRAMRMFVTEDARVIAELESLLGPRRTEEFLNHPNGSHNDHTFGVGPRKP